MGFLTFIIREAPAEMAIERKELAQLVSAHLTHVHDALKATAAYHKQLETRLIQLPEQIAKGINPAAIAARVGKSLRQGLQDTGIHETANELRLASSQMAAAATGMQDTLAKVSDPRTGVLPRVNEALSNIQTRVNEAVDLSARLYRQARLNLPWFAVAGMLLVMIGMVYNWPSQSPQPSPAPVIAQLPPKTAELVTQIQQQQQQLQELQQRLQDTEAQLADAQAAAADRRYPRLR
jgi:Skp family chaperone for outer membrane proteins